MALSKDFDSNTDASDVFVTERKNVRRAYSRSAMALAAYTAVSFLAVTLIGLLFSTLTKNLSFTVSARSALSLILSTLPMYVFGLPVYYLILRRLPACEGVKHTVSFKECLVVFLISRFLITVGSLISQGVVSLLQALLGHEITDSTTEIVTTAPTWVLLLFVVILAPIIEEVMFRKWMFERLRGYGELPAILFTSVLFGIGHGNFFQFLYAFLLGVLLAYLFSRTNNILYPIGFHMLTNFLGSIAVLPLIRAQEKYLLLVGDGNAEELLQSDRAAEFVKLLLIVLGYEGIVLSLAVTGLVLFCIKYKERKGLRFSPPIPSSLTKKDMARAMIINLGAGLFLLTALTEFVLSVLV